MVQSTTRKIKLGNEIINLIIDVIAPANAIRNIQISYCNRVSNKFADGVANKLEDSIAERAHTCTSHNIVIRH